MIRIRDTREKVQLAMDQLLNVKEARSSGVRPFRGIREAYTFCTGDSDLRLLDSGGLYRTSEAIATTDFPNILLNSLTKKLIQDYQEYNFLPGLEKLYIATKATDYKTQDRVRLGYLQDLPTVAESGPYTELTKPTDEKVSYSLTKKDGLLTIPQDTTPTNHPPQLAHFPHPIT